jgi:hypothetical protein
MVEHGREERDAEDAGELAESATGTNSVQPGGVEVETLAAEIQTGVQHRSGPPFV